jgi:L-fuconolactonase
MHRSSTRELPDLHVDAHQHFWRLDRADYGWLAPELTPLYRNYLPCDLAPHLQVSGVGSTILVQAAATEAETRFLLDIAQSTPFVAGVVGWVDMEAPDIAARLAALIAYGDGYLKGIRPMIQDIADPNWIVSPRVDRAFDVLEALDLRFDALVRPIHLEPLLRRLEPRPNLRVVIDHAAKPEIIQGANQRESPEWSAGLASIASHTSALCKLSGLLTEARPGASGDELAPFVDHVIASFGAERIMWGSDWPVLNLASDYSTWHAMAERLLAGLTARERALIFGGVAAQFYGVSPPEAVS